ncbi:protein of unknown function [Legionella fallonii LLAP-10]|uniref:Uncharacterized protein n=1 Tax=Legionella fallonii LLAP-10 TaxID=1212491 RepID=A0A098G2M5_9GAMM|nr:protein of unknown function [Legionella fallonii LLAP-10]
MSGQYRLPPEALPVRTTLPLALTAFQDKVLGLKINVFPAAKLVVLKNTVENNNMKKRIKNLKQELDCSIIIPNLIPSHSDFSLIIKQIKLFKHTNTV